jgi:hypothetical protein
MLLFFSWKHIKLSRLVFFILFAWASWANWTTALNSPDDYLGYTDLALISLYKNFIQGWFSEHIQVMVGIIATSQALVAISLLLRGWIYKIGIIGGTVFLIAIMPLGIGSAFPCTLILAVALKMLYKDNSDFILERKSHSYHIAVDKRH